MTTTRISIIAILAALSLTACSSATPKSDPTPTEQPVSDEPAEDATMKWTWTGFEVVGHRSVTREQALEGIPFEVGAEVGDDSESISKGIHEWCLDKKDALGVYEMKCGWVRYGDGETYAVINVLEEEDAKLLVDRAKPTRELALSPELDAIMDTKDARRTELFDSGSYEVLTELVVQPDGEQAYLSYPKDPATEKMARELAAKTPAQRAALLEAVEFAANDEVRARAATLLNWAGDHTDSIRVVHTLLDDPSGLVRNNITRFMLHYVERVEDPELQASLVRVLLVQALRPSHGDRNKALYGLLYIAKTSDAARDLVLTEGRETIERLAEQSVLSNVGGIAKEILALETGAKP